MAQFLAQQKEGTDEWYCAYEQLNKIDEQLRRMTEDTLKTFSEEFKNSITGILDALDKRLYNGIDPDDVKRRWEKAKKEQEKYLTLQEKIVWAGRLQSKIQQQINESNNPEVRGKLQKFLDEELATLKQKDKLSKYDVERAEQLYEITQNQIALEEARNDKNLTRLVRDSQGNWAYQYVENTEAVREAQEKLSESLEKLMKIDQDQLTSVQDELIDLRDEFRKRVEEIVEKGMSGQYSQDQMYAALEEARSQFIKDIEKLRDEHGDVINNLDDSTEDAVGNIESLLGTTFNDIASRWTDSINMIIRGNSNFQNDVTSAIVNVKAQWQSYQNKVSEVVSKTNETVQELIDKARTLALETEQLQKKTEDVIDKINAEWESVEQLRQSYMDLQESYKKAAEEAQNYIESIKKTY
jgi:hypothetical protein